MCNKKEWWKKLLAACKKFQKKMSDNFHKSFFFSLKYLCDHITKPLVICNFCNWFYYACYRFYLYNWHWNMCYKWTPSPSLCTCIRPTEAVCVLKTQLITLYTCIWSYLVLVVLKFLKVTLNLPCITILPISSTTNQSLCFKLILQD